METGVLAGAPVFIYNGLLIIIAENVKKRIEITLPEKKTVKKGTEVMILK